MDIHYKIQQSPHPKTSDREHKAHIRPISTDTVTTTQLCEVLSQRCTLTGPDIKCVLDALSEIIPEYLNNNTTVHLDGLGFFSLSITGDVSRDEKRKRMKVDNARVRSILFKPEKRMIDYFQNVHFKEGTYLASHEIDDSVIEEKLTEFFSRRHSIRSGELCNLLVLNKYDGRRLLKRLTEQGALVSDGRGSGTVYIPLPGHFGV